MKRLRHFCFVIVVLASSQIFGGAFIKGLKEGVSTEKLFTTAVDEKKKQLKLLLEEQKKLSEEVKKFSAEAKPRLEDFATQSNQVKAQIKREPQNEEFLNSKLSVLNDLYQTIKDSKQAYKQLTEFTDGHIKLLQEYLEDPNLENYLKEYGKDRSLYSFEDLQTVNQMVTAQRKNVGHLEEQEKNSDAELSSRSASAEAAAKAFSKKQEEVKAFGSSPKAKGPEEMFGFDEKQKMALLVFDEQLSREKQILADLRLRATKQKVGQIKTKLFVAKLQLKALEKVVSRIRPLVKMRDEDVAVARADLNKKRQQSLALKGKYRKNEEILARSNEARMVNLEKLSKQYNIPLGEKLNEWSIEPKATALSFLRLCDLGRLNSLYLFDEQVRELLEAQIALEDERLRHEKIETDLRISFHGIKSERFKTEEARNKEIAEYDAPEVEISATISRFKERENAAKGLLSAQKRARENIDGLLEHLNQKGRTIFKNRSRELNRCDSWLREAQKLVKQQIATTEKTISVYRDIITTGESAREQITFIIGELKAAIGILRRSEEAIKWEEIRNIGPDIRRFFSDIRSNIVQFRFGSLLRKIGYSFPRPISFVWLFFKLLILLGFLLLFRFYAGRVLRRWSEQVKQNNRMRVFTFLMMVFLDFVLRYYIAICSWIIPFSLIKFGMLPDYGLQMLFYLASIPYFLILANRFLARFILLNQQYDYFFLTKQFQPRFSFIISTLSYSTIIIQLFRTAFVLGSYQDSGLPVILMALNFIILQICLIFLITKEQILSLIPETTNIWKQIHAQVDKFFYVILAFVVAIIVMINPYVGFGRLVLHVLSRLFLTVLFLPLFFWAQTFLKKISSKIFFATDNDVVKERFPSAKSWYGLSVILFFVGLVGVASIAGAWIWGWSITLKDILEWLRTAMFHGEGGKPISVISFLQIFLFLIAGLFVAYAFIKFVLRKIFDLLLVEMGIQHAVISLTRYLIIIAFVMIGLENVGLGPLTKYLLGIILAVAWVIKEPLGDLVAYFILLIQRPLKIGDYIQIDEQTSGVVRRITPRSIVLRQKNSTTIVVPNAQVLAKSVTNWNYVSGFVALNDITVRIHYKEDPDKVIKVLLAVIETHPNILKSPKPIVRLEKFGDYAFEFLVRCYVSSHFTLDMWTIASDIRLLIIRTLRENNIEMALPKSIWISASNGKPVVMKQKQTESLPESDKK